MGNDLIFKAVSEHTGGAFGLVEYTAAPWFAGPPPHIHTRMIEAFYVLEGELTVQLDGHAAVAGPGAFALVSAGTPHTFSNPGAKPVRFLVLFSPGGFEKYLEELPEVVAKHGYPPPPDIMVSLGKRYDFELVGPPGSA